MHTSHLIKKLIQVKLLLLCVHCGLIHGMSDANKKTMDNFLTQEGKMLFTKNPNEAETNVPLVQPSKEKEKPQKLYKSAAFGVAVVATTVVVVLGFSEFLERSNNKYLKRIPRFIDLLSLFYKLHAIATGRDPYSYSLPKK